ncbi:TPA: hypothetical protein KOT48_003687 [Clostridioides difficile]|nr:hypothetical protein [Clostridioides difficile]
MKNYIDDFDFGFYDIETSETIQDKTAQILMENVANKKIKSPTPIKVIKQAKVIESKEKTTKSKLKEECFVKNETLLTIVYYLGNGVIFKEQLIKIMKRINLTLSETGIKKAIKDLKDIGFLKEQQLLRNHKRYCLYLTKYPIGKIEGKPSVEVTGVRLTQDKILNSLYRVEHFINTHLDNIANNKIKPYDINEMLMDKYNYLLIKKHEDNVVYQSLWLNFNRDELTSLVSLILIEDKNVALYDWINKINKATKNREEIQIPTELIDSKIKKINNINTIGTNADESISKKNIDINLFNIKNLINRNFYIENIQYVEDSLNGMKITLTYLDIKDNTSAQTLHRDIAYAYLMFQRYFNTHYVFLEVNVRTWSNTSKGKLKRKSFEKNKDGYITCFNEYYNAGLKLSSWKNGIVVNYCSLNLDKKYNIKSDS